jgi:threonyl-tRNA synthetase
MIHRALLGSMERFLGILLEQYGGALPLWLSPVQVKVLPISEKFMEYAGEVCGRLCAAGVRAEVDGKSEKIGYKIRSAEMSKVPYMAVVGEKERAAGSVAVRRHGEGDKGTMPMEQFVQQLLRQIHERANN